MRKQIRLYTQVFFLINNIFSCRPQSCYQAISSLPLFAPCDPAFASRSHLIVSSFTHHPTSPVRPNHQQLQSRWASTRRTSLMFSWSNLSGQMYPFKQTYSRLQTRLSDFSEYRTKDDMQLTELGTIKASERAIKPGSLAPTATASQNGSHVHRKPERWRLAPSNDVVSAIRVWAAATVST